MKTVFIVGGVAVGAYLLWKYAARFATPSEPAARADASGLVDAAATSSMTPSGQQATSAVASAALQVVDTKLPNLRGMTDSLREHLARADLANAFRDTARADAQLAPAAPGPASFSGIKILGVSPIGGRLPAYDQGTSSRNGLAGYEGLKS